MATQLIELKAAVRERVGKGAARHARRESRVPAVVYGAAQPAESITVEYNELWKQILRGKFTSTVFEIDVNGKKTKVIPRDIQLDPVKDTPIHVDFLRIAKDGIIRVFVPVKFVNEALSPGLKRGGVLNIVRHDIEVFCPYDQIPPHFEADLEGLEIGRSLHISAIEIPANVTTVIQGRDFTVASIAGAVKDEDANAAVAAAAEGEEAPEAGEGDAKAEAAPEADAKDSGAKK